MALYLHYNTCNCYPASSTADTHPFQTWGITLCCVAQLFSISLPDEEECKLYNTTASLTCFRHRIFYQLSGQFILSIATIISRHMLYKDWKSWRCLCRPKQILWWCTWQCPLSLYCLLLFPAHCLSEGLWAPGSVSVWMAVYFPDWIAFHFHLEVNYQSQAPYLSLLFFFQWRWSHWILS